MQDAATLAGADWLDACLGLAPEAAHNVAVMIAANLKPVGFTPESAPHAMETEFLSERELNELLEGLAQAGFYVQTFLTEEDFVEWSLTENDGGSQGRRQILYNLAQRGRGPGRHATLAAWAQMRGIPLIDSDPHASSIARQKFHASRVLGACGIPVARTWWFAQGTWVPSRPPTGTMVIAKPTYDSASIGIEGDAVLEYRPSVDERLEVRSLRFQQPLAVQEFVAGMEAEVPVLEFQRPRTIGCAGIALDSQPVSGTQILTYADVLADGFGFFNFTEADREASSEMQRLAVRAFRALGFRGIGRIDFRIPEKGPPQVMEVAAKPHLTSHSSFAFLFQERGYGHRDLMAVVATSAALRHGLIGRPKLNVAHQKPAAVERPSF